MATFNLPGVAVFQDDEIGRGVKHVISVVEVYPEGHPFTRKGTPCVTRVYVGEDPARGIEQARAHAQHVLTELRADRAVVCHSHDYVVEVAS
ncbi:MAG TPA: hypothetical protein VHM19_23220 [Polyangiales bacterium]|jgi:hypothetical protein|nr:hypothetical protein [Polyangiales bacterium]